MPQALRELSCNQRHDVIRHLHQFIKGGWLTHGAFAKTARELDVSARVVSAIWRTFRGGGKIESNKAGNVGRPKRYTVQDVQQRVGAVPFEQRSTMRDISVATGIPVGTKNASNFAAYATLAETAGHAGAGEAGPCVEFDPLWDVVHLDEKWFNADKDRRTMYLLANEAPPCRSWKSKRFIPKVMFLAAVARPRFDEGRGVLFDGKIGMWPFVDLVPAVRSSRNRPAGTLVTTLVNVNANVYRDYVINKVVPAIKASFPSTNKRVILQQDNATPHRSITDAELASVSTDGWTFVVRRQPPNSPDLNVLDLGFFASIQSLQLKKVSRTVDEVIRYTLASFDELSYEKLECVFLTFQAVMRLVLEHAGDNKFALPHLKKAALRRAGLLMSNMSCPVSLLL
ncbi:hypothetical protein H257_17775 [Aphanomyces astaci]|uniref:Uncharacterized protein n=1 Tax=Aphanomyces astaci TaxID=112090 RepID=W4FF64_APHAT|nr:hypothetical protein H257_17775 [Aphanomyces astaci]ETV65481.1 hypothetical protein H257_17775 [Aphanomyces astaci]|eukprot:XP_009844969.1 hypothetical protein H257_17775 [Aphanomyces astaci]